MAHLLRRLAVLSIACVVILAFGAAPAWAAPAVSASPSTGLVHGQLITVSGSGFPSNSSFALLQCIPGGTDVFEFCDLGGLPTASTDASGSFSSTFRVRRIITVDGARIDCAASPGTCLFAADPFSTTYDASTALAFDPSGPLPVPLEITVSDVTAVVRDNEVLLQGTVTCTEPVFVSIQGRLRQVVQRFFINGFFSTEVECDGEEPFAVVFEGQNGVIKQGRAELDLTASGGTPDGSDTFTVDTTIRVRSK